MNIFQSFKKQKLSSEENFRIFGSLIIALSGFLLFLDKILSNLGIDKDYNYGFYDYYTFVWTLMQSIVPILIIFGAYFRPYLMSFLIPIYAYAIQIIWIFQPNIQTDNGYLHVYAIGTCSFFILLIYLIEKISHWRSDKIKLKKEFQQEAKEILDILKSKNIPEK